jgi:hypothetical protein
MCGVWVCGCVVCGCVGVWCVGAWYVGVGVGVGVWCVVCGCVVCGVRVLGRVCWMCRCGAVGRVSRLPSSVWCVVGA